MASIHDWQEMSESELRIRLEDAMADAYSAAESNLVSMVQLNEKRSSPMTYPREIVRYLNSQNWPDCLLNN